MDPTTSLPPAPQLSSSPSLQSGQPAAPPVETPATESVQPQVAEVLQKSKNVLVTVGVNPSVDELAAALGLTVLLSQLGKHATAVFSGKIPPAIEFLDPEKTFEDTVDSLRDFIIALDKEKADKLRYKVEDDVVKIFITPYRTVINEKDLEFTQGDFNVDVVVALGVEKREELDQAITAHGRILHDATFITVNAGEASTAIGTINWSDSGASSIAEMLVHLSESFGEEVLDSQISTAFLTGIVAETNRFSNEKTTPKVMTLSAQLMAAGANQQLIASNLRQEGMISESVRLKKPGATTDDGEMVLTHKSDKDIAKKKGPSQQSVQSDSNSNKNLSAVKPVDNAKKEDKQPETSPPQKEKGPSEQLRETLQQAAPRKEEQQLPSQEPSLSALVNSPASSTKRVVTPLENSAASSAENVPTPPEITLPPARSATERPQFGGTLNSFADTPDSDTSNGSSEPEPQETPFTLTHNSTATDTAQDEAVEAARKAVEEAAVESPHKRLEPVGATLPPEVAPQNEVVTPASESSATSLPPALPEVTPIAPPVFPSQPTPPPMPPASEFTPPEASLPPMPPLPNPMVNQGLPPVPPLQPQSSTTAPIAPQTTPSFLQDLQASQNNWTQAGQNVAEAKSAADEARQVKIEERLQHYDQAVDRNRELQGLPPVNNPNGSGLPPVMPPQIPR